jgi:hypothetical protein
MLIRTDAVPTAIFQVYVPGTDGLTEATFSDWRSAAGKAFTERASRLSRRSADYVFHRVAFADIVRMLDGTDNDAFSPPILDMVAVRGAVHFDKLCADFTVPDVLGSLALNVMTEFVELLLNYLSRVHGVLAERSDARAFLQQELRHSSALHARQQAAGWW